MSKRKDLRKLIEGQNIVMVPGCYDAFTAIVIESVGFPAIGVSGFGLASTLGFPDVGLTTMSEVLSRVDRIVDSVNIPVIADIDTGYGGIINAIRTIHEFEKIGVAAVHVEDQIFPKKCGSMRGKQLVSKAEMISRLHAILDERHDRDFVVIARTDALGVSGFDDAVERSMAYQEAGADVIFLHGPRSLEEITKFCKAIKIPVMIGTAETTRWVRKQRIWTAEEVSRAGVKIVTYATSMMYAAAKAMKDTLIEIKTKGTPDGILHNMMHMTEFTGLLKLESIYEKESRYACNMEEL